MIQVRLRKDHRGITITMGKSYGEAPHGTPNNQRAQYLAHSTEMWKIYWLSSRTQPRDRSGRKVVENNVYSGLVIASKTANVNRRVNSVYYTMEGIDLNGGPSIEMYNNVQQ